MQIIAFTFESFVFLFFNKNQKVTSNTVLHRSFITLSIHIQLNAIHYTRRNIDRDSLFNSFQSLSIGIDTAFINHFTSTTTSRTSRGSLHHTEHCIHLSYHLSATITRWASFISCIFSFYFAAYFYFLFSTFYNIFQGNFHTYTQVFTFHIYLLTAATKTAKTTKATRKMTTKYIAKLTEYIVH